MFNKAPNATRTINAMKRIFANKGVPYTCQSDNGPPFQSEEVAQYAKEAGFTHKRITPEWPRANGTVERFNRTMKEAIQTDNLCGIKLKEATQEFLQMYRTTPHRGTGASPFSAMHGGREMRMKFPLLKTTDDVVNRETSRRYKEGMKDEERCRSSGISVGDKVIVRKKKKNKLSPFYGEEPLTVVKIKGSTIIAQKGNRTVVRDASLFRKVNAESTSGDEALEGSEDSGSCEGIDDEDGRGEASVGSAENVDGRNVEEMIDNGEEEEDTGEENADDEDREETRRRPPRQLRRPQYLNDYVL